MKEALLYACPSFTGTKFCGGPDELSRETWKVLFKNSNLLPAFDHAYRAELHLEEVGPLPERLIIEGSQLVWPFWRDPLQPVFRSLFGRDCDWGLYLLKQTPDQLMKQIMMRNRPHEQVLDLEWIAKGASHYSDHFETVPSLWVHKDACQGDPALLRKRITEFLFQQ